MSPLRMAVDAVFHQFGVDVIFTPDGGPPVSVRVLAKRPDEIIGFGETRIHTETAVFEVRVNEVAEPRPGDRIIFDGINYIIQGEPERRDPDRLVWTLDVRPA